MTTTLSTEARALLNELNSAYITYISGVNVTISATIPDDKIPNLIALLEKWNGVDKQKLEALKKCLSSDSHIPDIKKIANMYIKITDTFQNNVPLTITASNLTEFTVFLERQKNAIDNLQKVIHDEMDSPFEDDDYNKYWYNNNRTEYHRGGDRPAIVYTNGAKKWYHNGKLYRMEDKDGKITIIDKVMCAYIKKCGSNALDEL